MLSFISQLSQTMEYERADPAIDLGFNLGFKNERPKASFQGYNYVYYKQKGTRSFWLCLKHKIHKCKVWLSTTNTMERSVVWGKHNHPTFGEEVENFLKEGACVTPVLETAVLKLYNHQSNPKNTSDAESRIATMLTPHHKVFVEKEKSESPIQETIPTSTDSQYQPKPSSCTSLPAQTHYSRFPLYPYQGMGWSHPTAQHFNPFLAFPWLIPAPQIRPRYSQMISQKRKRTTKPSPSVVSTNESIKKKSVPSNHSCSPLETSKNENETSIISSPATNTNESFTKNVAETPMDVLFGSKFVGNIENLDPNSFSRYSAFHVPPKHQSYQPETSKNRQEIISNTSSSATSTSESSTKSVSEELFGSKYFDNIRNGDLNSIFPGYSTFQVPSNHSNNSAEALKSGQEIISASTATNELSNRNADETPCEQLFRSKRIDNNRNFGSILPRYPTLQASPILSNYLLETSENKNEISNTSSSITSTNETSKKNVGETTFEEQFEANRIHIPNFSPNSMFPMYTPFQVQSNNYSNTPETQQYPSPSVTSSNKTSKNNVSETTSAEQFRANRIDIPNFSPNSMFPMYPSFQVPSSNSSDTPETPENPSLSATSTNESFKKNSGETQFMDNSYNLPIIYPNTPFLGYPAFPSIYYASEI